MDMKIYRCPYCGNLLPVLTDGGVRPVCCGEEMELLTANTTDGATDKHVPVIDVSDDSVTVTIGEQEHPMTGEHHIKWIVLLTDKGVHLKRLEPLDMPVAKFCIPDETAISAYAYCNLHGLWKGEI